MNEYGENRGLGWCYLAIIQQISFSLNLKWKLVDENFFK